MKIVFKTLLPLSLLFAQETNKDQATPQETFIDKPRQVLTRAQQKSGFILGIEALFGEVITTEELSGQSATNASVMGRFFGGYQHYFDENLGIRALVSIQDSTPTNVEIISNSNNTPIKENILAFWLGSELDMLWDFYSKGDHTLGLNGGLGYNFEIYYDRKVTLNNTVYALPNFYQHNLYPVLGLHYYYDQHQFGINYRFIGTLNSAIKEASAQNIKFKTKITYENYLNLSYSYRF